MKGATKFAPAFRNPFMALTYQESCYLQSILTSLAQDYPRDPVGFSLAVSIAQKNATGQLATAPIVQTLNYLQYDSQFLGQSTFDDVSLADIIDAGTF